MSENKPNAPRSKSSGEHPWDEHRLNKKDRNLIGLLRDDGHMSNEAIGRRCGVHGSTVGRWYQGKILCCSPKHYAALVELFDEVLIDRLGVGGLSGKYGEWHCHLVLLICFKRIGEAYCRLRSDRTETRRIVRHVLCALSKRVPHRHILGLDTVFKEILPSGKMPSKDLSHQIEFNGEITKDIAALVRRIRDELGVDRRDLSAVMGVSLYSIRNWENCETKRCRNAQIEILNALLNRRLDAALVDHHHYISEKKSVPKKLPANLRAMLEQAMEKSSQIVTAENAIAEYLSRFVRVMNDAAKWLDRKGSNW